jgi:hypothetical protein
MVSTSLRISNAHVNVAFALVNRPKMGDLIVQRCKNHVIQHNMICVLHAWNPKLPESNSFSTLDNL